MSAQATSQPSISIEAASDERRRGLSWSDGAPVARATASVPVTGSLSLEGSTTTLWGSSRHGGADAVIDLGAQFTRLSGGWRLTAEGRYHLFPGASGQGYGEVGGIAGFSIGPASVNVAARYAPRQSGIGGDNLYVSSGLAVGVPGTPLTLSGHVGRSSGSVRDPIRSARLRPDGAYWDHGVALDWYKGRWSAGLRYVDTDMDTRRAHLAGASIVARVGLTL